MFLKNKKYTIILVLVILAILVFVGYKWYKGKMELVERGWADPKFPFHEYTILEWVRLNPPPDLNDEMRAEFEKQLKNLPTRTVPLETLDKYIQALEDGDIERAAECCLKKDVEFETRPEYREKGIWTRWQVRDEDKEHLYWIKEKGYLSDLIQKLEEIRVTIALELKKITKGSRGKDELLYKVSCSGIGDGICYIKFVKDLWGDWKLASPEL